MIIVNLHSSQHCKGGKGGGGEGLGGGGGTRGGNGDKSGGIIHSGSFTTVVHSGVYVSDTVYCTTCCSFDMHTQVFGSVRLTTHSRVVRLTKCCSYAFCRRTGLSQYGQQTVLKKDSAMGEDEGGGDGAATSIQGSVNRNVWLSDGENP